MRYRGYSRKLIATGALALAAIALNAPGTARAATPKKKQPTESVGQKLGLKPQKKLDFNNALVETMNERPLDSLSALSEADRNRKKPHLYKKRTDFLPETAETLRQVRYN